MPVLRTILDFLELRPVFTLLAVQVFWWLYILEKLYSTHWGLTRTFAGRSPAPWLYNWFEFAFTPLRVLVALATARLLLEVLLALLMPAARPLRRHPSLGQELLAFVDLRPFFNRWWLQMFWWLYLLTFLRAIYPYFFFSPPWVFAFSAADWFRFFHALINPLIWLVGVRLLIEVALALQTRTDRVRERTDG
jgi:hypothetical protein